MLHCGIPCGVFVVLCCQPLLKANGTFRSFVTLLFSCADCSGVHALSGAKNMTDRTSRGILDRLVTFAFSHGRDGPRTRLGSRGNPLAHCIDLRAMLMCALAGFRRTAFQTVHAGILNAYGTGLPQVALAVSGRMEGPDSETRDVPNLTMQKIAKY